MKMFLLATYQYSKFFIKETVLFLQIALLIIVGYVASISFIYTYQINNTVDSIYTTPFIFFDMHSRVISITEGFAGFTEDERLQLTEEISNVFAKIENVGAIGKIGYITIAVNEDVPQDAILYNTDMINNTNIPLSLGNWDSLNENVDYIPIVVSEKNSFGWKYGDLLPNILYYDSKIPEITFKVVGLLKSSPQLPRILEGGTEIPSVDFILGENSNQDIVILNEKSVAKYQHSMLSSALLFLSNETTTRNFIQEYKSIIAPYGNFFTLESMKNQQWIRSALINREEIIILSSILFLILFSIIGYNLLGFKSREKQIGIFLLNGMSPQDFSKINLISSSTIYIAAYICSIPFCISIYNNSSVLWVYCITSFCVMLTFVALSFIITRYLISRLELNKILRGEYIYG